MQNILISIKPKWCELIESGKKTIEVRKTRPKIKTPFKCYIYETLGEKIKLSNCVKGTINRGCGKIIGEFICDKIETLSEKDLFCGMDEISCSLIEEYSCIDIDELLSYKGAKKFLYAWHISDLKIYDKPRRYSEFYKKCPSYDKDEFQCDDCLKCENPCGNGGKLYLKRPPQSWCFVEEGEGEK